LAYFVSIENVRTSLLPALLENPSVREEALDLLAVLGSRPVVEALLASPRVKSSPRLLQALRTNANLRPNDQVEAGKKLAVLEAAPVAEVAAPDAIIEETVTKYLEDNAVELAAENDKTFEPIGGGNEEESGAPLGIGATNDTAPSATIGANEVAAEASPDSAEKLALAAAASKARKPPVPVAKGRDSTLQKISKLDIRGRITLAMRGSKEDRSILIRDSTKLVAIAVLESPKVSDGEVESFALQKNVLEAVLRAIPMRRRFAKNYNIMRNLVYNPRTPLDLSLGLMKNLLIHDLKTLSGNKEVPDTIRKLALRMFKQKLEKKN
jgi:hypothetical protein